jgi:hypothetical protein
MIRVSERGKFMKGKRTEGIQEEEADRNSFN